MQMNKNDIVVLSITDLGNDGEGIGKVDGFPVFVKGALPGDVAHVRLTKLKKTYGYGRLERMITPSPDRIEAPCPISDKCGGCVFGSWSYEKELSWKNEKVKNALIRIGGFDRELVNTVMEPPLGAAADCPKTSRTQSPTPTFAENSSFSVADAPTSAPSIGKFSSEIGNRILRTEFLDSLPADCIYGYRNKTQLPVGRSKDGRIVTGFYAGRTHVIVENETCLLTERDNSDIVGIIKAHMDKYSIEPYDERTRTGLVRHILIRTGVKAVAKWDKTHITQTAPAYVVMVCLIINGKEMPHEDDLTAALREVPGVSSVMLNTNTEATNVILGDELRCLYGDDYITDTMGELSFRIGAKSFYQVNRNQAFRIYRKAEEYAGLTGKETVLDLYCGIGTISLFMARHAGFVYGVEIVPEAIDNAVANAVINGIDNVEFITGAADS